MAHPLLTALALLPLLGSTLTCASEAKAAWLPGSYELVGTRDAGILLIHRTSPREITFSINVVHCMHECGSDSAVNHIASLEQAVARLSGSSATYGGTASRPGPKTTCTVTLSQRSKQAIRVRQEGECEEFGQGVGVHGEYRLSKSGALP